MQLKVPYILWVSENMMDHMWFLLSCNPQRLQLRANVKCSVLVLLMMFGELSLSRSLAMQ